MNRSRAASAAYPDVVVAQLRALFEDFLFAHTAGEISRGNDTQMHVPFTFGRSVGTRVDTLYITKAT